MWAVAPGTQSGATKPHLRGLLGGIFPAEAENRLLDPHLSLCPLGKAWLGARAPWAGSLEMTRG